MSFFDKAKEKAKEAAEKAAEAAKDAAESAKAAAAGAAQKIEEGGYVDKVAGKIDEKTKGKYSDKIAKAAASTKGGVEKLKSEGEASEDPLTDVGPAAETPEDTPES